MGVLVEMEQQALVQGQAEGVPDPGYMLGTPYVSPTMALSPGVVVAAVVVVAVDLKATHMLKLLTANQERP
jgi:hypothetical protein